MLLAAYIQLNRRLVAHTNINNHLAIAITRKCVVLTNSTMNQPTHLIQEHFQPPEHVRFMQKLDRTKFTKEINIPCLIVTKLKVNGVTKNVKKYLFKVERMKPVISNSVFTTILLNPQLINKFADFDTEDREHFASIDITAHNFDHKIVTLTYDNFKVEDILRAVLPAAEDGLSSYTKVGHITHVNLREHLHAYKSLIGQVLLDKVHGCRSVVNKASIIDNTYRNFRIELLCGEENYKTEVRENTCRFEFDFSKVYWNSRLSTEHERIINKIKKGDVLFDVFAGVGPFSVPASKKGCLVYANDLNPHAFDYLNKNVQNNLTDGDFIETYNLDGRVFIQNELKEKIINHIGGNVTIHIVMNLPALSCDFLAYFVRLFEDFELEGMSKFPILYVYTFSKGGDDCVALTKRQIALAFGWDVTAKIIDIYKVRAVSSNKDMMRVTVRLDKDILTGCRRAEVQVEQGCARADDGGFCVGGVKRPVDDVEDFAEMQAVKKFDYGEEEQQARQEGQHTYSGAEEGL